MSSIENWGFSVDGPFQNDPLAIPFDQLTGGRREVIDVLVGRSSPLSERELAARLATRGRAVSPDEVDASVVDIRHRRLRHVQLPILEEADLVEWDRSASTVEQSDHLVYEDPRFRAFVGTDADLDDFEGLVDCLSVERRRHVLVALEENDEPVTVDDLVRAVLDRDARADTSEVAAALHHVDLPKLEAVGLIDRSRDGSTVAGSLSESDEKLLEILQES